MTKFVLIIILRYFKCFIFNYFNNINFFMHIKKIVTFQIFFTAFQLVSNLINFYLQQHKQNMAIFARITSIHFPYTQLFSVQNYGNIELYHQYFSYTHLYVEYVCNMSNTEYFSYCIRNKGILTQYSWITCPGILISIS